MNPSNGKVIDTLEDVVGQTSDTRYDLFFTNAKLIAAIVLHPSDLFQLYAKRTGIEELLIGGAVRRREVQTLSMKLENQRREGFRNKTPEQILATHAANLEIRYENVLSAKVARGLLGVMLEFDTCAANGNRRKLRFRLHAGQFERARTLLDSTLPDKIAT